MTFRLQPFLIFKAELTRLNDLYWTSKYAYSRTIAILRAIADTSISEPDPRVDSVWSSTNQGELSRIARPLSGFVKQLEKNEGDLRFTSILHMCSAFETGIANYYSLCALYSPEKIDVTRQKNILEILSDKKSYHNYRDWAINQAIAQLRGKYTKRLNTISSTFLGSQWTSASAEVLDEYYHMRHLIAHDQSLTSSDAPDWSAIEVIKSQVSIDETTWKAMIRDFQSELENLDKAVKKDVVTDKGLALGIYRIIDRDGPMQVSELKIKLGSERKIPKLTNKLVMEVAQSIQCEVQSVQIKGKVEYLIGHQRIVKR
jgi:hypothetical protein